MDQIAGLSLRHEGSSRFGSLFSSFQRVEQIHLDSERVPFQEAEDIGGKDIAEVEMKT